MEIEQMQVGYHNKVALKEVFPISTRYALRKSLGWAAALLPFIAICAFSLRQAELGSLERRIVFWAETGAVMLLVFKYLYGELYRQAFNYEMEGFRFVISRGVILKKIGSLPLLPVTEIYIQRSPIDILCGLANVDIFTPMDQTRQFARIEALTPRDAHHLQTFLGDLLTTQVFLAPAANDGSRVERERAQNHKSADTRSLELPLHEPDMPVQWKRNEKRERPQLRSQHQTPLRLL
jgi:membrane protein YdbS with pleckstrin-like domain